MSRKSDAIIAALEADAKSKVKIDEALLDFIDQEMEARHYPDREMLVNRILKSWMWNLQRQRIEAMNDDVVMSQEIPGDQKRESNVLYEIKLRELDYVKKFERRVFISRKEKQYDGSYLASPVTSFPVSRALWIRDTLLPWIAERLTEAEAFHRARVSENLSAAQAKRANRSTEEKVLEAEFRSLYTAEYGKEVWSEAVAQATRHRSRAEGWGLTEHFTMVQWINLAALADFKCANCGANAPLQTHHVRALSTDGTNKIDNIQLLCKTCHDAIPMQHEDGTDLWLASEAEVMQKFAVGTTVRRKFGFGSKLTDTGVIEEVIAPVIGSGKVWCQRISLSDPSNRAGQLILPKSLSGVIRMNGFMPARFQVLWTRKKQGSTYTETLPADNLTLIDTE